MPPIKPETESHDSTVQLVELAKIRLDGGTQPRSKLYEEVVNDYAEDMKQGAKFPPVTLYYDGKDYWLADGFHRVRAKEATGETEIESEIISGELRDAVLHSVGANAHHGLRRTNADKRRAVIRLVRDREWSKWSNREISRRCGVSDSFVGDVRRELSSVGLQIDSNEEVTEFDPTVRLAQRGGTVYEIDTTGIRHPQVEETKPKRKRAKRKPTTLNSEKEQLKNVKKGDLWRLGKSHYLYCGVPSSKKFLKYVPSDIALLFYFPQENENWASDVPFSAKSTLIFHTSYGDDFHLENLRTIAESCLSGTTDAEDPVVMVNLIDPSLFILIDELECPCFCAEPDPQRCSDALMAWSITNQPSKRL